MNVVVSAAPAQAPRARAGSAGPPAGGDFAAALAGAGGAGPTGSALPQEPADTPPADPPVPEPADEPAGEPAGEPAEAPAEAQAGLDAAVLAVAQVVTPPVPAPVVEDGTSDRAGAHVVGAVRTAGAAPAEVAQPDLSPTPVPRSGAAPVRDEAPSDVPDAPVPALAPSAVAALPSDRVTTAVPDAVALAVPAEAAWSAAIHVLDARSTASPAAPATGGQTSGAAVPEAVLPADALAALPSEDPLPDAPADAPAAALAAAPAGTPLGAGAEAGVTSQPAADLRAGAPAAPAPAAPPPAPATQVVQLLGPVLTGPDGAYSLSLQLYPEELGAVQVEVLLRGGEIRLALHASDEAAQAALRSALPDLRADLLAGGLSASSLSVDDGRSGQSSLDRHADRSPDRRPDGQGDPPGRRSLPYADPDSRPLTAHSDAALDLRM